MGPLTLEHPPIPTLAPPCIPPTPRASTHLLVSPIQIVSFNASNLTENDTQARRKNRTHSDTRLRDNYQDEQDIDIRFPIIPWTHLTNSNTCLQILSQDNQDRDIQ